MDARNTRNLPQTRSQGVSPVADVAWQYLKASREVAIDAVLNFSEHIDAIV